MSNSTIDQLLKITTSKPASRDSFRDSVRNDRANDNGLFRAHLDRAADATETKTSTLKNEDQTTSLKEEQPLETQTGQDETSTTEQDDTASATEAASTNEENNGENNEAAPSEDETADEVTLSAAATGQQAEAVANNEQEVVLAAVVASTSTENQQQSEGQQAATDSGEVTEETSDTTKNNTIETLAKAQGDQATSEGEDSDAKTAAQQEGKTDNPATQQAAATSVGEGEVKKSQTSQIAADGTSPQAEQTLAEATLETLPGSDKEENSSSKPKPAIEIQQTAANSPSTSIEADLLEAKLNSVSESVGNSPTNSTANETLTGAERALPTSLNGKAANSSQSTEASNGDTPTVDRARFIRRVGGAIRSAQLRGGPIQLQLSPPELGTLKIELTIIKGVMTAKLEVESVAARAVILDNLPALRERLAAQEISIDKFDVDVGQDDQQPADFSENKERQEKQAREQANQLPPRAASSPTPVTSTAPTATASTTASGLDISI